MNIITDRKMLRLPCDDVLLDEAPLLRRELAETLLAHPEGAALAAPQIGLRKRAFAMRMPGDKIATFMNPEIISMEEPLIHKNEGCLSFPGVRIDTIRYNKIVARDDEGELEIEGWHAIVFEHETDHLNQVLMFDRKVPESYDACFCGSKKKFKFCCRKKIAR